MTDNALVPLTEMQVMAQAVARSGLFGMKTPDQALALMLISHAEGRHPALAAMDYDIVQGRPAKRSQAMLRDFLANGGKVEWHCSNDEKADATFTHQQGGSIRIDWDLSRAAKVTTWSKDKGKMVPLTEKDNWRNYPRAMLRARVISEGVRAIYPAATGGLYEPSEIIDITEDTKGGGAASPSRPSPAYNEAPIEHDSSIGVDSDTGEILEDDNYSSAVNLLKSSADKGAFKSNWEAIRRQKDAFPAEDYQKLQQLMQSEAKRFMEPA